MLFLGIEIYEVSFHRQMLTAISGPTTLNATSGSQIGRSAASMQREPIIGVMVAKHYQNHRMLEMIQSQQQTLQQQVLRRVDLMRSRAVRRVEWRLENAPMLHQNFAEGKPVCSTAFQAAGIDGLQMVFYPNGAQGVREGFCSFFLLCPAGCTLRCWLWAGRWKREARKESSNQPELLGRLNFARFENCVDPTEEFVDLAVEIEEAHQITGNQSGASIGEGKSLGTQSNSSFKRVDTSTRQVQYTSAAQSKTAADSSMQLPNIWTPRGFYRFGDIDGGSHTGSHQQPLAFKSLSSTKSESMDPNRTLSAVDTSSQALSATPPLPPSPGSAKGIRPSPHASKQDFGRVTVR
jgi:hypothetical protein